MTFLRHFSALAILSILLINVSSPAKAQQVPLNIAVVNIEKILATASAPKSIMEQIKAIRATYREEVQKEEETLRQANQELAQKQSLLAPEAFQEERRKFEQEVMNVQKKVQQKNLSLQNAQKEAQKEVQLALRDVVLALSKEKGFTLVLRRAQTVIVADPLDVTDQVIAALNKKLPKVSVTPK
jgi:Skp family chaperone for outer membrane proteins